MKLGQTVATIGVKIAMEENERFSFEVAHAFARYLQHDWGNICDEDKQLNNDAVRYQNDRILAAYDTCEGKIYIITEWDGSITTILFAEEY